MASNTNAAQISNDNPAANDLAIQQLLTEMAEALRSAEEAQNRYSAKLNELEQENIFLSETIKQNKLGLITTERRDLLRKVSEREDGANRALEEARAIRSEYDEKLDKVSLIIKDVASKQNDLNGHIEKKAEAKIAKQKKTLGNKYNKDKTRLQKEYEELKAKIQKKIRTRTIVMLISIAIAAVAVATRFLP